MPHDSPSGLIMAGGRSTRFGSPKALHVIDGKSMIERVYDAVSAVASPVLISVAKSTQQYDLPLRHVPDLYKDHGPLAGLHAGLSAVDSAWVVVVAVDLPFITPTSLNLLIDHCSDDADAVIAMGIDRDQPLCGCYRASLVEHIEEHLLSKQRSVRAFLRTVRVTHVDLPEAELYNANRP